MPVTTAAYDDLREPARMSRKPAGEGPGPLVEALALAARALPRPPGAKLAFAPVEACTPEHLPEAARNWAERRRNSFAAGRRAAGKALVESGYQGRGILGMAADGLPAWPPGWIGSISHTDMVAGAVVMPARNGEPVVLGFDLERIVEPRTAAEIASSILPEARPGASGLPLAEEITRAFSAKEALYKALYPQTRRFRGFEAARAVWRRAGPQGAVELELVLAEDWGPGWPMGSRLPVFQAVAADHVLTIVWR